MFQRALSIASLQGISSIFSAETGRTYSPGISLGNRPFLDTGGASTTDSAGLGRHARSSDPNIVPTLRRDSIVGTTTRSTFAPHARSISSRSCARRSSPKGSNIFNHANYDGYNRTLYASNATTATTPLSQPVVLVRQNNFGIANNDGSKPDGTNARRLQFSLRLKF